MLIGASAATLTVKRRASTEWPSTDGAMPVSPAGAAVHPVSVSRAISAGATASRPRLAKRARTSKACPGTGAAIDGGGANAANGPVGSATPAGCAVAVSSRPRHAVIASSVCRSLMRSTNSASSSPALLAIASRMNCSAAARPGAAADGSVKRKSAVARPKAPSTRASWSVTPSGDRRPSVEKRPE